MRCEHCYIPSHTHEGLSFDKIKGLLSELRELGVVNVSLTGGEIFLRDDLFEIIEMARSLYMRVFLLSNGTLLNSKIISRLKRQHISEFSTTIFSMNSEIHDAITKQSGSLTALLRNISELKKAGITIRVKTPLMKKNFEHFTDIQSYCKENEFDYLVSPLIFSKNDGDRSPINLRIDDSELPKAMKIVDSINRNDHLHINDVPCAALFYSFAVDCKGDVYPCNSFFYKVGNIYHQSLRDIWYSSEALQLIKSIKISDLECCSDCNCQLQCDRCPGMVFMEENNLLSCDHFAKKLAKIRQSNYSISIEEYR
jgi:radical SAM protein with 4Fe4S-binding SPASM domain